MESLSSPGKHNPAFVSVTFIAYENISMICVFSFLSTGSLLYDQCMNQAHTNRRLPKTASTLTVSSDDMDERDVPSESGLLFAFFINSITAIHPVGIIIVITFNLYPQNTLIVRRSKYGLFPKPR